MEEGNLADAFSSMVSDLDVHADFQRSWQAIGPVGMLYPMNGYRARNLRYWIEGFR